MAACFVCGSDLAVLPLRTKRYRNEAYFPFLEQHDPPDGCAPPDADGLVLACRVCFMFLNAQWEIFERENTPHVKRLYWLKRSDDGVFTGAEMSEQAEYAAQIFAGTFTPTDGAVGERQSGSPRPCSQSSSVGLSPPYRSSQDRFNILSEMPQQSKDFKSILITCYICGISVASSMARFISTKPLAGEEQPYFPFLATMIPARDAQPLSPQGITRVCTACFEELCSQWFRFELRRVDPRDRVYKCDSLLMQICFLCESLHPRNTAHRVHSSPSADNSIFFPFLTEFANAKGQKQLSRDGCVNVCPDCFAKLLKEWDAFETKKTPLSARKYSWEVAAPKIGSMSAKALPITQNDARSVASQSVKGSVVGAADSHKTMQQQVPVNLASISQGLMVLTAHGLVPASLSTLVNFPQAGPPAMHNYYKWPKFDVYPGSLSQVCYLCGTKSQPAKSFVLHSQASSLDAEKPFFKLFCSRKPAEGADKMCSSTGTVAACQYCYLNLINQWLCMVETKLSKGASDGEGGMNFRPDDFVCFVCGLTTVRQRMKPASSAKFPFLLKHPRPKFSLILNDQPAVLICTDCHSLISAQYDEYERLGVSQDLRKYNWMPIPYDKSGNQDESKNMNRKRPSDSAADEGSEAGTMDVKIEVVDCDSVNDVTSDGNISPEQPTVVDAQQSDAEGSPVSSYSGDALPAGRHQDVTSERPAAISESFSTRPSEAAERSNHNGDKMETSYADALKLLAKRAAPTDSSTEGPKRKRNDLSQEDVCDDRANVASRQLEEECGKPAPVDRNPSNAEQVLHATSMVQQPEPNPPIAPLAVQNLRLQLASVGQLQRGTLAPASSANPNVTDARLHLVEQLNLIRALSSPSANTHIGLPLIQNPLLVYPTSSAHSSVPCHPIGLYGALNPPPTNNDSYQPLNLTSTSRSSETGRHTGSKRDPSVSPRRTQKSSCSSATNTEVNTQSDSVSGQASAGGGDSLGHTPSSIASNELETTQRSAAELHQSILEHNFTSDSAANQTSPEVEDLTTRGETGSNQGGNEETPNSGQAQLDGTADGNATERPETGYERLVKEERAYVKAEAQLTQEIDRLEASRRDVQDKLQLVREKIRGSHNTSSPSKTS